MAAELITPLDEISGMPLPILPQEHLTIEDPTTNWHHAWHPKTDPGLLDLGGRALRHSRAQLVRMTDHNHGDANKGKQVYHDFYAGPELPKTDREKFYQCVLSAAGYVPERAIDLRGDEPVIRRMTAEQLRILQAPAHAKPLRPDEANRVQVKASQEHRTESTPKPTRREFIGIRMDQFRAKKEEQALLGFHHIKYNYESMRNFFRELVLSEDFTSFDELRVEEFLLTRDTERKQKLGHWLIEQAAARVTDDIQAPYRALRQSGRLHPNMPFEANELVLYKLGAAQDRVRLGLQQEDRLRQQLGLTAA